MDAVRRRFSLLIVIGCAAVALLVPSGASAVVGGTISGTLLDQNGDPLNGVCVFVLDDVTFGPSAFSPAVSNASGVYSIVVPADTYKVAFSSDTGFGCPAGADPVDNEFHLNTTDFASATPVGVTDGNTTTVNATLHRIPPAAGSIGGEVVSRTGAPLDTVCVGVLDANNQLVAGTASDPAGQYSVGGLDPGSYKVIFITTQPACPVASPNPVVTEYHNNKASFATADFVSVSSGLETDVDATLVLVDDPVANDNTATVAEDSGAAAIDVLTNDTDNDGDTILITGVTQPDNGTVATTGGGTGLTYMPDANYCNGGSPLDTFVYTVSGGDTATVSVTVTCSPDEPDLDDDSFTVDEDSTTQLDVLANDSDPDGDLEILSVGSPTVHGIASVVQGSPDKVSYTPDANYCGSDNFLYQVSGETATVTITVTCVPDATNAVNDTPTVNEDSSTSAIDVLGNDSDADGDALIISAAGPATRGNVQQPGPNQVTYRPDDHLCGPDEFDYTVNGQTATVTVTVTCVEDAANADNDTAIVAEDSGANTINVRLNDDDFDTLNTGGTKDLVVDNTDGAHGAVAITNGGADVSYTPAANYCGDDAFTYEVAGGDVANVAVSVACVEDNPVALNDAKNVGEDSGATAIDVLANDTDVDGGAKLVGSKTNAAHGAVAITNSGADVSYTPDADYCGADSFTYSLNGGSTATVTVDVTCVDDPTPDPDPDPPVPGPGPDTQAPNVKIDAGPSGKTKDTTPTFNFSSSDATARFTCSVDGGAATACTSPFTTKKLKKGKHTFSVIATDAAGNASAAATQSFTVKKKKKRRH